MTSNWGESGGALVDFVGDRRQLASVRRVELRDGAENGVRALVFSTGGGLDFWVLQDRSMDIGLLNWKGMPLAWQHPAGFAAPGLSGPFADSGTGTARSLGGFLVTCGLDNVRQPRGSLPLHGTLPFTPARLTSCGEDWDAAEPMLFAQAEIACAHLDRASFRLSRRIEAPIAGAGFSIRDRIENIGPEPAELMVLYHMNFGFPLVAEGTRVQLDGKEIAVRAPGGQGAGPDNEVRCFPAGGADGRFAVAVSRPAAGAWHGARVEIAGDAAALPFVQLWRDARRRRNVLAIEPVNCDRNADGTSAPGMMLAPGETWSGALDVSIMPADRS
jgi:Domain of unknown function (DUF4432)